MAVSASEPEEMVSAIQAAEYTWTDWSIADERMQQRTNKACRSIEQLCDWFWQGAQAPAVGLRQRYFLLGPPTDCPVSAAR